MGTLPHDAGRRVCGGIGGDLCSRALWHPGACSDTAGEYESVAIQGAGFSAGSDAMDRTRRKPVMVSRSSHGPGQW